MKEILMYRVDDADMVSLFEDQQYQLYLFHVTQYFAVYISG